jgi:hypothetical protein
VETKRLLRFSTSVDSALAGRNDALSFCCTSEVLLLSDASGPPTTSHTRMIAAGSSQRSRRTVRGPGVVVVSGSRVTVMLATPRPARVTS